VLAGLILGPLTAQAQELPLRLTWVDRTGKVISTVGEAGIFRSPELSPDGKRIAVHRHEGQRGGDIWLDDSRGGLTRFTADTSQTEDNASPIFSPDGARIVFASLRNGKWGLYIKGVDGRGAEQLLIESGSRKMPMSWSPDGQFIIYWISDGTQWVIPATGKGAPQRFLDTSSTHAQISPDGKWVAYNSIGGLWVKPFPTGTGKWQIAQDGVFARWRGDSRELYFLSRASFGHIMVADINVNGSALAPVKPRPLFVSGYINLNHPGGNYHTFAVSPDGQRFLIPRPEPNTLTMIDRGGKMVKTLGQDVYTSPAFSPDGTRVAVINGNREVVVVDVASGRTIPIASHEPPNIIRGFLWSPDGKQLVYLVRTLDAELLYRSAADGTGTEQLVTRLPGFNIALSDWTPDGRFVIYYTTQLAGNALFALPMTGDPKPVEAMRSQAPILGARLSPDGRLIAYQSTEAERPVMDLRTETHHIWVRRFDMATGGAGEMKWSLPAEASHDMTLGIWWKADGRELYYLGPRMTVMSVEVNPQPTLQFGTPRPLFTAPADIPETGFADVRGTVSRDGQRVVFAVHPPGSAVLPPAQQQIALVDRQGRVLIRLGGGNRYAQPSFSPDGTRVAAVVIDAKDRSDIWVFDIASGKGIPITNDATPNNLPLWTHDGRHILYTSLRPGGYQGVYRKSADGSGAEELLYRNAPGSPVGLRDLSPDGKYLTFNSGPVLLVVPLTGSDPLARKSIEFSREEFDVQGGWLSPDGKFIAYGSNESGGDFDLYVRGFDPATGTAAGDRKWKVSSEGAAGVVFWRNDGREIYFLDGSPDGVLMAAEVSTTAAGFESQPPRVLLPVPGDVQGGAISRDGQRFAFIVPAAK